ncbi:MAG: MFS transporter [Phycisphaerales bacterium]|nr:MFS transporter [Phycisphaerales bacterium]MCB9862168.1 MFS transporter [Phycisphaerales bacterium]
MSSASNATRSSLVPRGDAIAPAMTGARANRANVAKIAVLAWFAMLPVTMLTPALKEVVGNLTAPLAGWMSADWFELIEPLGAHAFQSINMLGAFVCVPLLGRYLHQRGMLKSVAALALAADGVLLATMSIAPSVGWLLGIRFFEGAAHVIGLSALMAIGASFAPENRRGRAMGIIGAAMMFGTACGTRLGGVLWTHLPTWFFYIAGLTAAVTALGTLLFAVEPASNRDREAARTPWTHVLRSNPSLGIAYAYAFIDRFCVGVVISTFVLFLANVHALAPDARSRLLVMFLLPFAALVYPAGRLADRIGRVRPIALGSAGFGVVFVAYGLIPLEWMPVAMIVSGVLSALMFAPNLALCADLAPESHRGAAFTGFNIAGSLGFLLGPIVAGGALALMHWMEFAPIAGYRMAFLVAGGGEVICAAVTLPMLRDLARRGITC